MSRYPGSHQRILVAGGGISGLLAAWHLRGPGREVEVWEATLEPGGWAQTLAWPGPGDEPGFLERGPQSLRIQVGGALDRLLQELDVALQPTGSRGPRWLGKDGGRHPGPTTLMGLLRAPGLSWPERLRMFAEPWIPAGGTAGESLQDYFTRRLGAGFARELLPAVVAGVLAAPPQAIDAEALPRLARWEARGGLLLGSLKEGREHTRVPLGGVGTLARSLASRLGSVHTGRRALALEPLPGGRWRVLGEEGSSEADQVVLALPPQAAAKLLEPLAPDVARSLASLPSLDLRVWHSRHPMVEGWERGIGLLVHPPEARGLLGTVSLATDDPRGVAGLLQLRTYAGGAYPIDPPRQDWSGIFEELRHWLPELPEPTQVHLERCPAAFPLLAPGHRARVAKIVDALPPNLHWLSAARLGPGLPDLAAGVADWALNGPCGMA